MKIQSQRTCKLKMCNLLLGTTAQVVKQAKAPPIMEMKKAKKNTITKTQVNSRVNQTLQNKNQKNKIKLKNKFNNIMNQVKRNLKLEMMNLRQLWIPVKQHQNKLLMTLASMTKYQINLRKIKNFKLIKIQEIHQVLILLLLRKLEIHMIVIRAN